MVHFFAFFLRVVRSVKKKKNLPENPLSNTFVMKNEYIPKISPRVEKYIFFFFARGQFFFFVKTTFRRFEIATVSHLKYSLIYEYINIIFALTTCACYTHTHCRSTLISVTSTFGKNIVLKKSKKKKKIVFYLVIISRILHARALSLK